MTPIVLLLTLSAAALPAQVSPVRSHDRARNLALVTFDVRDTSVGDVLELLRRQTGHDLATPGVPAETFSRKVSIAADAQPLTMVLHKMGMTPNEDRRPWLSVVTPQSLRALPSTPVWRSVPGATFAFSTEPWKGRTREVRGTILRTAATLDAHGLVTWDLLHARGDGFDDIETCNWHSPEAILLTGDGEGPIEVVVAGSVWWYRTYKVVFERPEPGASFSVEDWEVRVEWPEVVMTPSTPVHWDVMRRVIERVEYTLVDESKRPLGGDAIGLGGGGARSRRRPDWCGCTNGVTPLRPIRHPHRFECRDTVIDSVAIGRDRSIVEQEVPPLSDILRLEVHLRVPVEEPFRIGAVLPVE